MSNIRPLRRAVLGVDPGPEYSGLVLWDRRRCRPIGHLRNVDAAQVIAKSEAATVAIEDMVSYGRPVGRSVLETCYWIGYLAAIAEQSGRQVQRVSRRVVKQWLGLPLSAGDRAVWERLVTIYPVGTPGRPGPLYDLRPRAASAHCRSAAAVAIVASHCAARR